MSSKEQHPADQAVRDECLDTTQSFVVTAPAGSGKTSLLTQRTLALLASVDNPEAILCITFTRKAAAEMRQRIVNALEYCANNEQPNNSNDAKTWRLAHQVLQRDAQLDWQILLNPSRLKITTIDGFCRSITNQLPLASGIGLGMMNLELPEQAYRQAARDTLQWLEKPPSVYHKALKKLLLHLDGNTQRLEDLFYQLLLKRDQWLPYVVGNKDNRDQLENYAHQLIEDQLTLCRRLVVPFSSDLITFVSFCANTLVEAGSDSKITLLNDIEDLPDSSPESLPYWQSIAELLLTTSGSFRQKFDKRVGLPAGKTKAEKDAVAPFKKLSEEVMEACHAAEGLAQQLTLIKLLPPWRYTDQAWDFLQQLTVLLPVLVGHLKTHFSQINSVDFTEISQAAVQALDPDEISDILLRLDHQINHILVDEFQDTSQIQLDLLSRLTEGWQSTQGKTLFLVGDGMQSCYGFRGAEVGLFLDVKAHGLGEIKPLARELTTNFRSEVGVVNWVNMAFSDAFPKQDDIARGAVKYCNAIAFRQTNAAQLHTDAVHCYGLVKNDQSRSPNSRATEADTVLEIIQQIKTTTPDDSIAVLVRSRGHLSAINTVLTQAGFTPQATEIEPLANRQSIMDLWALTKALLYPADRLSWFAVLRAPWAALSPAELLVIANQLTDSGQLPLHWLLNAEFTQMDLKANTKSRLRAIQTVLIMGWQNRRRKKLRVWLESIWAALNGAAGLTVASDLENIQSFWGLIDSYDNTGYISDWDGFKLAIEKLYAAPASEADPNLNIMTLHKSKGLEFDHVIIPALDKGSKADSRELLYWQTRLSYQGDPLLLMAPIDEDSNDKEPTLYRFLHEELKLKNRFESVRLLYVGCTRAIKQLHLLAELQWDEKNDQAKAPAGNSLVASIWPLFESQMKVIKTASDAQQGLNNPIETWHKIRRVETDIPMHPGGDNLLEPFRGQEVGDQNNTPDLSPYSNYVARSFGTVLHQLLEVVADIGIDNWSADQLKNLHSTVSTWLAKLGLANNRARANDIIGITIDLLNSEQARWLLSNQRENAASELEILETGSNKLFIIDRTFIDQGQRWIIDYKTSKPSIDESLEQFLAREEEHYRAQLTNYANLFASMEQNPVVTALYFPIIDCLHVVDVA